MQSKIVVISGTAGSGKNSIIQGILNGCTQCVRLVTATTREPRPGEEHGKDYYFMSEDDFLQAFKEGLIPEHRHVETGAHYGIYTPVLDKLLEKGKVVLTHVDIIGARYLKEKYGALTIFIKPESIESLERRVRARAPMSDAEWDARRVIAEREIREHMPWYDHVVENPDGKLEEAIQSTLAILRNAGYIQGDE